MSVSANRLAKRRNDFRIACELGLPQTALILDGKRDVSDCYVLFSVLRDEDKKTFEDAICMIEAAGNPRWAYTFIDFANHPSLNFDLTKQRIRRLVRVIIEGDMAEWAFWMLEDYDKLISQRQRHVLADIVLRKGTKTEMHMLGVGYNRVSERQRKQLMVRHREIEQLKHLENVVLPKLRKEYGKGLLTEALRAQGFMNELDF